MDMPTYAFRCSHCDHDFEVESSIAARDENAVCPKCGSREVRTVFGRFAVGGARSGTDSGRLLQRGFGEAARGAPKP